MKKVILVIITDMIVLRPMINIGYSNLSSFLLESKHYPFFSPVSPAYQIASQSITWENEGNNVSNFLCILNRFCKKIDVIFYHQMKE